MTTFPHLETNEQRAAFQTLLRKLNEARKKPGDGLDAFAQWEQAWERESEANRIAADALDVFLADDLGFGDAMTEDDAEEAQERTQ